MTINRDLANLVPTLYQTSSKILVGVTTARSDFFNTTTVSPKFQVETAATDNLNRFASITSNNSDTGGATLLLAKTRGTTVGSVTIVQNDDQIGAVSFQGADGANLVEAARIQASVDGTPGSDDMPGSLRFYTTADGAASTTERMRITSAGNVGIGTTSPSTAADGGLTLGTTSAGKSLIINSSSNGNNGLIRFIDSNGSNAFELAGATGSISLYGYGSRPMLFWTNGTERGRITDAGALCVGTTTATATRFNAVDSTNSVTTAYIGGYGDNSPGANTYALRIDMNVDTANAAAAALYVRHSNPAGGTGGNLIIAEGGRSGSASNIWLLKSWGEQVVNRPQDDGTLIQFQQAGTNEGSISVSGNTVSYNAFVGGHWTQLQEGRGYNPEILRGTVMSSIGEMAVWKSAEWTETIEHPAVEAVEGKEAVLDEEGNVVEPAVEAVEGKDAYIETKTRRESYLGNLPIGATFEEDGFTKTVVDDGNERLPKVKISDVVGDKAVYGVFQTYDEVQDMLISSLGAFVVRIASGVTVQIGDLLESNGDGCAKVQDDDVIRSKTIGKVTSTVATATYADGSYTVPCVLYCG